MTSAERAAETRRQRAQAEKLRFNALQDDCAKALALCRRVRDDEAAAFSDRLRAVALLWALTGKGDCTWTRTNQLDENWQNWNETSAGAS